MVFLRALPVFLLCLAIAACAVHAPPIKEHAAIEVPDGKNTKTLELRKITSRVSRGTEIGRVGEGWGCLTFDKMFWRAGRGNVADDEIKSVFVEELKRFNYNVVGDPDDLFDNKSGRAELAVGGLITNIQWDVCFHNGYLDGWSKGSTYVALDIEWQVFSALDRKTIYKCSTTGQATAEFANRRVDEGFRQALAHAVQGLLANKEFYNLVVEKQPSGPMGGLSDAGADRTAPARPGVVAAGHKGKALSMEEAKRRVAIIQVPGAHGSGFLIGEEGYILTNHHVVRDNAKVRVIYSDGAKAEGQVLKTDPRQDVALVKVDTPPVAGLVPRLEDLPSGTDVFAIGAPFDMQLQGSLSKGIVSGYRADQRGRWLQSDVTVNGGNSGGPLVDQQGRVVGICSWGMGETNTGVNFFIPIVDALRVMGLSAG